MLTSSPSFSSPSPQYERAMLPPREAMLKLEADFVKQVRVLCCVALCCAVLCARTPISSMTAHALRVGVAPVVAAAIRQRAARACSLNAPLSPRRHHRAHANKKTNR